MRALNPAKLQEFIKLSAGPLAAMRNGSQVLELILFISKRLCLQPTPAYRNAFDEALRRQLLLGPDDVLSAHRIANDLICSARDAGRPVTAVAEIGKSLGREIEAIARDAKKFGRRIERRMDRQRRISAAVSGRNWATASEETD